jgi:hypothetical protein
MITNVTGAATFELQPSLLPMPNFAVERKSVLALSEYYLTCLIITQISNPA